MGHFGARQRAGLCDWGVAASELSAAPAWGCAAAREGGPPDAGLRRGGISKLVFLGRRKKTLTFFVRAVFREYLANGVHAAGARPGVLALSRGAIQRWVKVPVRFRFRGLGMRTVSSALAAGEARVGWKGRGEAPRPTRPGNFDTAIDAPSRETAKTGPHGPGSPPRRAGRPCKGVKVFLTV